MARLHRTAATLRFGGDHLNPDEISQTLGAPPTDSWRRGDIRTFGGGRQITARTGHWSLSAPDECPADLDKQVAAILSGLSNDLQVWRNLSARFGGDIFVGLFLDTSNEGLSLSPATTGAISARGLTLGLDIYSGDEPD